MKQGFFRRLLVVFQTCCTNSLVFYVTLIVNFAICLFFIFCRSDSSDSSFCVSFLRVQRYVTTQSVQLLRSVMSHLIPVI